MSLRDLSLSAPPTRTSAWTLLTESWGYFSGGCNLNSLAAQPKFQESQLRFVPDGHDHSGDPAGVDLGTLRSENLNLQSLSVAWRDYFEGQSDIYYLLTGFGVLPSGDFVEEPVDSDFQYAYVLLDWDPEAVQPDANCTLDHRRMSSFNTSLGVSAVVAAWISVSNDTHTDDSGAVINTCLIFDTNWYVKVTVRRGTVVGDVTFDYILLVTGT